MPGPTRELVVIMFTDIVGYSSLMGRDEQKALQMLRDNRALHKTLVKTHHGELLKEMGDGMLVMFHAAYDSIQCALDIQRAVTSQGNYQLRIGLHLGDIMLENEDVFGDDVNIASRIESIADPGGIYLSESIYKTIRKHANISVKDLGEFQFKNISDPIRTYAVLGEGLPVPSHRQKQSKVQKELLHKTTIWYSIALFAVIGIVLFWKFYPDFKTKSALKSKQSIAVLPFHNLSEDSGQELIVDGLHDAIIGQLSKIPDLRVISRTSTLRYRGSEKTVPEIAEELKVGNIIEASVLGTKTSYRIQMQLIKAFPLESHVWSEEYNCNVDEALNIQDEVARSVAQALDVDIGETYGSAQPVNPEVYKLYLRGMHNLDKGSEEEMLAGMEFLNEAVELDPAAALAYSGLAQGYMILGHSFNANVDETECFVKAKAAANQALELDKGQAEAYAVLAEVKMYHDWDYIGSEDAFKKAIIIKPSMAEVHAHYTWIHAIYSRWEEAIKHAKLAIEIDPFSTVYTSWLAWLYWYADMHDDAIEVAQKTIDMNPDYSVGHMVLGSAFADKGMYSEAIPELEKAVELFPGWVSHLTRALMLSGDLEEAQRVFEDYKDNPRLGNRHLAYLYAGMGLRDETILYLNKMIEDRNQIAPWLFVIPHFRFLHDDPDFLEICRKANLPEEVINPDPVDQPKRTAMLY